MLELICLIVAVYVNVRLWQTLVEAKREKSDGLFFAAVVGSIAAMLLSIGLIMSICRYPVGFTTMPVKIMKSSDYGSVFQ